MHKYNNMKLVKQYTTNEKSAGVQGMFSLVAGFADTDFRWPIWRFYM